MCQRGAIELILHEMPARHGPGNQVLEPLIVTSLDQVLYQDVVRSPWAISDRDYTLVRLDAQA